MEPACRLPMRRRLDSCRVMSRKLLPISIKNFSISTTITPTAGSRGVTSSPGPEVCHGRADRDRAPGNFHDARIRVWKLKAFGPLHPKRKRSQRSDHPPAAGPLLTGTMGNHGSPNPSSGGNNTLLPHHPPCNQKKEILHTHLIPFIRVRRCGF